MFQPISELTESTRIVEGRAYVYAVEDLQNNGGFTNFLDFLIKETDERYVLKHYFFSLFESDLTKYVDKAFQDLGFFLFIVLTDEDERVLLLRYVRDTRELLRKSEQWEEISKVFNAYDKILEAKEEGIEVEELKRIIRTVTEGVRGLEDWRYIF